MAAQTTTNGDAYPPAPTLVVEPRLGPGSIVGYRDGLVLVRFQYSGSTVACDPKALKPLSARLKVVPGGGVRLETTPHRRPACPPIPSTHKRVLVSFNDEWDYQHDPESSRGDVSPDDSDGEDRAVNGMGGWGSEWLCQTIDPLDQEPGTEPGSLSLVPTLPQVETVEVPRPSLALRHLSQRQRLALQLVALKGRGHNRKAICDELGISRERYDDLLAYVQRMLGPWLVRTLGRKQQPRDSAKRFIVAAPKTGKPARKPHEQRLPTMSATHDSYQHGAM